MKIQSTMLEPGSIIVWKDYNFLRKPGIVYGISVCPIIGLLLLLKKRSY